MPKGFFITGTDTGVGKTIMAGAVIKAVNYMGLKAGAMKPIESGCGREGDVLIPFDGMFLKQMAHMDDPITLVTPCCLESPLAPISAAEADMTEISLYEIRRSFDKLSEKYEVMIVEGVGGLMVPIKRDYYVVGLARDLGLPLIVVARPGLGTINHIMLTLSCARKEGLTVAGIILNYSAPPEQSPAEQTNPKLLAQICPAPVIGIFPYLKNMGEEAVERTAIKNIDLELLRKCL
ncbi:MAG: dethiobiotin synthase [Nitrospiraceae bacterium]|nr:dethiobiotin synthase [Nitrospiraceae bacterium]